MSSPIDKLLESVKWSESTKPEKETAEGDLPHVTHSGVLDFAGFNLRCYRLSNGMSVFDADDFNQFMEKAFAS